MGNNLFLHKLHYVIKNLFFYIFIEDLMSKPLI